MGSFWFKNRQKNCPKKSSTSPNLSKYVAPLNHNHNKQSHNCENTIPGSASDTKIATITKNIDIPAIVIDSAIKAQNDKQSSSTSSCSSDENENKENELPKSNFEFPLLNQILQNRNRRATVAQIDVPGHGGERRKTLNNIEGELLDKKRKSITSSNENLMHFDRRRRTTLSNINEGVYKTYRDGMIAFVPKTYPIQDDYDLSDEVLGKGFNGKVTVAINKNSGTKYAVKCLKDSIRAKREIDLQWRACQGCQHIVQIIDVYENIINDSKRVLYVVMELMTGGQLFERVKDKTKYFTEKEIACIMKQICLAVNHLHIMGIAHRDLKPENLLYTSRDTDALIKLIDFGFAKEEILNLNTPCFTPYYVAPEIIKSEKYDSKCDIWALGIIMYMLCFKRPPFFSHSGEPLSPGMKKRIKNGQYSFPKQKKNQISKEAKDLIKSMLNVDNQSRISIDEILNNDWLNNYSQPSHGKSKLNLLEDITEISQSSSFTNNINETLEVIRSENNDEITSIKLNSLSNAKNSLLQRRIHKKQKP